jgi:NAD+ diphosphatase
VLVEDGDRCLLGRREIWPEGVYSTLAGFVEPGESLSEAVVREVREESGIEVGDVRYRSSQPWPFPSSLMLGFHAVRTGGDLRVDGVELEDARWFHRDDFARRKEIGLRLPSRVSIARRLIREWLEEV